MGVRQIQVVTTGYLGAPGWTNFYFKTVVGPSVADQGDAIADWLQVVKVGFPNMWSAQVSSEVKVFNEVTGDLEAYESLTAPTTTPVLGATGNEYGSGVSGCCIAWSTSTVNRGRLIRGRTFLVPLARYMYDADGTVLDSFRTDVVTASNALTSGGTGFGIWSRPRLGAGGLHAQGAVARVSNRVAFLSSRRS